MKWLLTSCGLLFTLITSAQNEIYAYARKQVDTLASGYFNGRGYVKGGDSLAAEYLKRELQAIGLNPYRNTYFQSFSYPVNTFPVSPVVSILQGNAQRYLQAGKDYLVDPACPPINGTFQVVWLDSTIVYQPKAFKKMRKKLDRETALLIDARDFKSKQAKQFLNQQIQTCNKAGLIVRLQPKKLTWSVATTQHHQAEMEWLMPDTAVNALRQSLNRMSVKIQPRFNPHHNARNVMAYLPGNGSSDSLIVLTAHYDHLGMLGSDAVFRGANDNASGCAMVLSLARYFASNQKTNKHNLLVIFFAGEEAGLLGSSYMAQNAPVDLRKIKVLLNLDLMGTGEEGITVVNATIYPTLYNQLTQLNETHQLLKQIKARGKAANSDHYPFSEKGVPALFAYTMGGIAAYHDIYDLPETLPLTKFSNVHHLFREFLSIQLN